MSADNLFLVDKEVCRVLKISQRTLSRIMSGFHRGGFRTNGKLVNLNDADPIVVSGYRRWNARKLAKVLDVTLEEMTKDL